MDVWNVKLPEDYLGLVQRFYEHGQKREIIECAKFHNWMNENVGESGRVRLRWSKERGLVRITLFDLTARLVDEPVPHFEEIGGQDDCFFQLRSIAMEYLERLRDTTIGPFKERLKNPLYK